MNEQMKWALSVIQRECVAGFYGSISINIQNGRIINTETKKTELPPK